MSFLKLLMAVPDSAVTMKSLLQLNVPGNQFDVEGLDKIVGDMIDGSQLSFTKLSTGSVQANGEVVFAGVPTAAETLSIANVTFTAVAANPTNNEFLLGSDGPETAANLATAINVSTDLVGICQATVALLAPTITVILAVQPGVLGNGFELSESLTFATVVAFANGSDGDQVAINFGQAS